MSGAVIRALYEDSYRLVWVSGHPRNWIVYEQGKPGNKRVPTCLHRLRVFTNLTKAKAFARQSVIRGETR